jgi:hypothetical protein
MSAATGSRLIDPIKIPQDLLDLMSGDERLDLTDREIADVVDVLATLALRIDERMDRRPAHEARCSCNNWGRPGLCAHHSYAFNVIQEAAQRLKVAADYLKAGQYPTRPS